MAISQIVCGVDGSAGAQKAIALADELGRATGSEIIAVHAFEPLSLVGKVDPPLDFPKIKDETEAILRDEWCSVLRDSDVSFRTMVIDADPVGALLQAVASEGADLIIVGTRGLGRAKAAVVGSVASRLPGRSPVPVLIVPPD